MTEAFRLTRTAGGRVRGTRRQRSSRVVNRSVDQRVWKVAVRLAGGDKSRIQVESRDSVLVRNPRST